MFADPIKVFDDYIHEASYYYLDLIRGDNPFAFTRFRHISILDLIFQMLDRKGGIQWSDIMSYYDDIDKKQNVTETAFYLARKKFNPEAIRVMSNEFIANFYDNEPDSFIKWKGNLVLSVDGSKVILPDTKENSSVFGNINQSKCSEKKCNAPVGGLLSTLHDCLNNTYLDVQFGPCSSNEKDYAAQHIETFRMNFNEKAIFTFDRGYSSMRLVD